MFTATEHTTRKPMRRAGDVSTWREAIAFLAAGAIVVGVVCSLAVHL